jgi:hypothetical protein
MFALINYENRERAYLRIARQAQGAIHCPSQKENAISPTKTEKSDKRKGSLGAASFPHRGGRIFGLSKHTHSSGVPSIK